jgi:hypothetical protein
VIRSKKKRKGRDNYIERKIRRREERLRKARKENPKEEKETLKREKKKI